MKKILMAALLLLTLTSLIGCINIDDTPPFGWPRSIAEAQPGNSYSCDKGAKSTFSKLAYFLIDPIKTQVEGISILIFENVIANHTYVNIIRIMLVLYLIIYGILVASSLVQIKLSDLIGRVVKIGILLALVSEGTYRFFNDHLFKLFTKGSDNLLAIVTNPYCDTYTGEINFFSFFNYVIDNVFTTDFLVRLTALVFAFPIGWICIAVLVKVMIKYLFAVLKAIIAYLLAFTAIGLLIALGPIFIALLLFDKTRDLFNKWIDTLVRFALEPVILFASIFFITMFINEALRNVLIQCNWTRIMDIYVNFGKGWIFPLGPIKPAIYWYIPKFLSPIGSTSYSDFLNYFASLIVLYLCVDLLEQLPKYAETISKKLLSGSSGVIGKGAAATKGVVQSGAESAKGVVGMDKASKSRRKEFRESAAEK